MGGLGLQPGSDGKIRDVECITLNDHYSSRVAQKLTLNEADLLDISSTTDKLKVLGDREDSVISWAASATSASRAAFTATKSAPERCWWIPGSWTSTDVVRPASQGQRLRVALE